MMAQVRKKKPMSPRQAAACCRPVDGLLDPQLFKALCDPTRLLLLGCLVKCARACTLSEIAECCRVDLSVVSRHLQTLERAGVLESSRAGRTVSYAVRYGYLSQTLRRLASAIEDCCPEVHPTASEGACCANS